MKNIFFSIISLGLSLPAFSSINAGATPTHGIAYSINKTKADTNTLNGQWFLQPLLSADTAAGKIPVLQVNLSAGTFSGNTGCNTMRGSFQKTDSSLVFNQNIITTKMACTGYDEAAFLRNLLRANRYKIEHGVLILMFDATELSRWTRRPDRKIKINRA